MGIKVNPGTDPPDDPPPQTSPPPTTTSSGSSGSSEPKEDPIVAQKASMFQSIYMQLWGEPATENYLKAAANAGLNATEFAWRERHKPEFIQTDAARNKASTLADLLHSLGAV